MAGYLGAIPVPQATQNRESFTCSANQTSFATAGYTVFFVDCFLNGVRLNTADFTATNGSDIVLASGAAENDILDVISYATFEINSQTFTGTTTMTDVVAATLDISGNIDIDGVTNLDAVDIDGAVNMATTALVTGVLTTTAATVFNGGFASNADSTVGGTLTATKLVSANGVLELDDNGSHNGIINSPASLFINIDSDNGATGEDFVIAKDRTSTSGGTELFRVQEDGNVGIGGTPDVPLMVAKDGTSHTAAAITIKSTQAGGYGSILNFQSTNSSGSAVTAASIGTEGAENYSSTATTSSNLKFSTVADGTLATRMTVSSGGNVGIGVAPATAYGRGLQIHDTGTAGANLRLTDSNTGSGTGNGFEIIVLNADNYIVNREVGPIFTLINGTTVQKIDATGAITAPKQPAFSARPSSTQSNFGADGNNDDVAFGTEVYDQNADFSGSVFTAPVAGKYFLSANVYLTQIDSAASYYQLTLATTNRNYFFAYDVSSQDNDPNRFTFQVNILADMAAGDTSRVKILQSGGTAQTDINVESHFSGYLAC